MYGQQKQKVYVGPGVGLDYGGVGGKIGFFFSKQLGLIGGVGYNFLSVGWNVGATYKISPETPFSGNLLYFWGYNAVTRAEKSKYEMTSMGITYGGNVEYKLGKKGNTLSLGVLTPIRSEKFKDNYEDMKGNVDVKLKNKLWPVSFSFGYNLLINK